MVASAYMTKCQGIFESLMSDGLVSLPGSDHKVAVKILRDTGSSELLICGIGLNTLSVPLHNVTLTCDLVQGDVELGVRPVLPVDGVALILGNNLAGGPVWLNESPPLVVTDVPPSGCGPDESALRYPEVFVTCAVTRSVSQARSEVKPVVAELNCSFLCLITH